jgi:hypothetical protein
MGDFVAARYADGRLVLTPWAPARAIAGRGEFHASRGDSLMAYDNDGNDSKSADNGGMATIDPPEAEAPVGLNGGVNLTFFASTFKKAEAKKAQRSGRNYATTTLIPSGLGKDMPQFWNVNAYDEHVIRQMLDLPPKGMVEVHAKLQSVSMWTRDSGESEISISVVATHIEPVEFIVRKREAPSSVGPPAGPREFAPVNALNDDGIPS